MLHVGEVLTTSTTNAGGVDVTGTATVYHPNSGLSGRDHGIVVLVCGLSVQKGCGTSPLMRSFYNICPWGGCPLVNRHKIEWRRQLGSSPWTLWGNSTYVKGM